jgi:hypothetical protein
MINEIIDFMRKQEVGIIQMPCPESAHRATQAKPDEVAVRHPTL